MSMQKYRVGIIGCGWVSTGHMNGYRAVAATEVVAAADTDAARLEEFSKEYGIRRLYTDYGEMLKREQLDIVSICTWPSLHCQITLEAAKHKLKAILCEKPITLSLSEARTMIEACDRAGCRLIVAHQRRLEGRFVKAKELLDAGEIGKLLRVEARQGDLFTDDHGVDLVRFYAQDAPVRWLMGQVDWQRRHECPWGHSTEESALAYIKFQSGAEGLILAGGAIDGHGGYSMVLTGSEGVIRIMGHNYPDESWVEIMNAGTAGWKRLDVETKLLGTPKSQILGRPTIEYYWTDVWQRLVAHVVDCIESDKESILDGRRAAGAVEIIAAVYESSRLRTVVHFPLSAEVDKPLELMHEAHAAQFGN